MVAEGHSIDPKAAETSRADSFVMGTLIHYPSESTLIRDGIRKVIEICVSTVHAARCPWMATAQTHRIKQAYKELLELSDTILRRATELCDFAGQGPQDLLRIYIARTQQVRGTADRRAVPTASHGFSSRSRVDQLAWIFQCAVKGAGL